MKKLSVILGVLGLCAFIWGTPAMAQMQPVPPPVAGNPLARGHGGYNPATVMTISGTVTRVKHTTPKKLKQQPHVRLRLQTSRGTIPVELGPAAFIDQQPLQIAAGDRIKVTGSWVGKGRKGLIIAGQVKKGGQVLQLRDNTGRPLWRGMMRPRR